MESETEIESDGAPDLAVPATLPLPQAPPLFAPKPAPSPTPSPTSPKPPTPSPSSPTPPSAIPDAVYIVVGVRRGEPHGKIESATTSLSDAIATADKIGGIGEHTAVYVMKNRMNEREIVDYDRIVYTVAK